MISPQLTITHGLNPDHKTDAARLYYEAFRQKLHPIFRDETRAQAVIADSMDGRHAFTATVDGRLAGIAGYKDAAGSLLDIGPAAMTRIFGFFGGWARLLALSVFARPVEPGVLLMDGIVVDKMQRSGGIGTRLLDAVIGHAAAHGYHAVRLDVVDTNPRARSLYERAGFVPVDAQRTPYLRWLFGFSGVTTMHRVLDGGDAAV